MKKTLRISLSWLLSAILLTGMMAAASLGQITVYAADNKLEQAVKWAIDTANDNTHGYSQKERWGPDYDCSSFVISAMKFAGINVGSASWTGDMVDQFTSNGFQYIAWSSVGGVSGLRRGDIMWRNGHTEMYIGNNQQVGAHQDYGHDATGDPSGSEISVESYNYNNWECVLRFTGDTTPVTYQSMTVGAKYYVTNNSTGTCLTVDDNSDTQLKNVSVSAQSGLSGQKFEIVSTGTDQIYYLRPELCSSSGRVLNVIGDYSYSGENISIYNFTGHSTQQWRFRPVSGGYAICSANYPNVCLAETSGNVKLAAYTGASNQIWTLASVSSDNSDIKNVKDLYPVESTYNFLKSVEGCSTQCFWDVSQWTIGYGNKCPYEHSSNGEYYGQKGGHYISEAEAKALFEEKLTTYVNRLKSNCSGLSMNQNQFDALLSATYNHGNVNNCPLKYYLQGTLDKEEARSQYLEWCINKGTTTEQGLRNRRKKEADLFFSSDTPVPIDDFSYMPVGAKYYLKNNGTGTYMSIDYGEDVQCKNISVYTKTGETYQQFEIQGSDYDKTYFLRPVLCESSGRVVNINGEYAYNNANIMIYNFTGHSTQQWKFRPVSGGYVICSANNTNYCISESGTNVQMATYTGASNQIWTLEPIHVHNYEYVYYLAAHPHCKCYRCSCGDVIVHWDESTPLDTCEACIADYKATLKLDKNSYEVGDSVTISWNKIDNATHYNLWIYRVTDNDEFQLVSRDDMIKDTKFTYSALPAGKYYTYFQTYNSSCRTEDGSDWFHSQADRIYFEINEHTHNYSEYVYYWKAHPHYKCYKCSCGDIKENRDETVALDTCADCIADYKATLSSDKKIYKTGEPVIVSWNKTANATHYNLWLYKLNDDGTVGDRVSRDDKIENTEFTYSDLPGGIYCTYFQTYNSNYWMQDGSDWFHSQADRIYFQVAEGSDFGNDFYAELIFNKGNMAVTNNNGNVEIQGRDGNDEHKIWHFIRQTDGSYVISSSADENSVIDVFNADDLDHTNIQMWSFNESCSQKWYLMGTEQSFWLRPECSGNKTMDVCDGTVSEGTNVHLYQVNGTSAQLFSIKKIHRYKQTIISPTCTKEGYTLHTCIDCDDSYRDSFTAALGHDYKLSSQTLATCTTNGKKIYTCSRCGDTKTEVIKAPGHSYTEEVVAPTCTEKGYTLHTCAKCGDSYKDTYTAAKGHTYTETIIPPTTTSQGYTLHTCSECGHSYKDKFTDITEPLTNNSIISKTTLMLSETVTVTARASGGTAPYQYSILFRNAPSQYWTVAQDYDTKTVLTLKPEATGTFEINVRARDANGNIVSKILSVTVDAPAALANTSTLSKTSISLGDSLTVTAKATGGKAPYTYGVYYKKASSEKWTTAQSYNTNAAVSIKPGAAVKYDVCVKVKDSKGTIAKKYFTVTVKKELVNNSTISAEMIKKGSSITATAKASGGTGKYTYGVYYKKASSEKWSTAQSYGTNTTVTIKPAAAVKYDICVKVKDSSGKIVKKYFTLTVTK